MLTWAILDTAGAKPGAGGASLLLLPGAAWAFVLVPAVVVLKHGVLLAPWQQKPADAPSYRRGLLLVWAAMEVGVVLCCIAAMVSDALLPGGLFAAGLTMALLALRPSAHAVNPA